MPRLVRRFWPACAALGLAQAALCAEPARLYPSHPAQPLAPATARAPLPATQQLRGTGEPAQPPRTTANHSARSASAEFSPSQTTLATHVPAGDAPSEVVPREAVPLETAPGSATFAGTTPADPAADGSTPAERPASTPLRPRGAHRAASAGARSPDAQHGPAQSLVTIGSSLAIVLGLFFLGIWLLRRGGVSSAGLLPTDVVEVLGRTVLGGRQQLQLIRVGNKLLLVSLTPAGAETLTEITDRDEVDRLASVCRRAHPEGSTASFRRLLDQWGQETHADGFLDQPGSSVAGFEARPARGTAATGGRHG